MSRLTKLAGLLVKSLAKPVSKRIKHEFSRYESTQNLLVWIGQTNHQITSRMTIWSAGYKVRSITPLDEEKAMKAGSEFVGESFIFVVTATIVVLEYNRSKIKEQEKLDAASAQAAAERAELQAKLHTLNVRLKALEKTVQQNSQSLFAYLFLRGHTLYEPPPSHELVPIDEDDENDKLNLLRAMPSSALLEHHINNNSRDSYPVDENLSNTLSSSSDAPTTENNEMINEHSLPEQPKVWWDLTRWWRR